MVRSKRKTPAELTPGWPSTPSPNASADSARLFALNLADAVRETSARNVAERADVHRNTIRGIVDGTLWPDAATISKLEHGLGRKLWMSPGEA